VRDVGISWDNENERGSEVILSHKIKYPQPSQAELDAAAVYWLSFNPYWWSIVQGEIADIAQSYRWDDYSEVIEQTIESFMLPHELPAGGDCPDIWVKTFDFDTSGQGWAAIGATPGAWSSALDAWQLSNSGVLYIAFTLPSTQTILGMSMAYYVQGTSAVKNARLEVISEGAIEVASVDPPANTVTELSGSGRWENVWSVRARTQIGAGGIPSQYISRVTVWGEGADPF
jgi:hypothetical protein